MKILFLINNGQPYGANKSLLTLIKGLVEKHAVLLFTPFNNKFIEKEDNIPNLNIPYFPSIFFCRLNIKYLLFPLLQLLNILVFPYMLYRTLKFKPDVIYSNSSVENMGKLLAFFTRTKYIIHVREFGWLDYSFISVFGKKFKYKYLNSADGLIFNSEIVRSKVMPTEKERTKCKVIYNGIETLDFSYTRKNDSVGDKKPIKVGIIGYLHKNKRQLEALEYMKPLLEKDPYIHCYIYGAGEQAYVKKIKSFILVNNLEKQVTLKGHVSQMDRIYQELDISLMFPRNEAFGRVTIESMLRGVPVIAYNGGGNAEILTHGVDGYLFKTQDEFISCFDTLTNDNVKYEKIREMGIKKVKEKFATNTYISKIEKFIECI